MKSLVQLILNATAAGKAMLLAANVAAQKTLLSLQNVDNTSDANKPVSTAQATADSLRVPYTGATGAVNIGSNALTAAGALLQSGDAYVGNFRVNVFNAAMSQWATLGVKGIYGGPTNVVFVDAADGNWSALNHTFTAYVPIAMASIKLAGPSGTTADVAVTRGASGVAEVNNGTLGTLRDLSCRAITASALVCAGTYTVGTLPSAVANAYKFATVSDSSVTTFGSTVAAGGSSKVMVFSNGTNWTVFAI